MSTSIFRRFVSGVTLITFAFAVTGCSAFKSSTQVFTVTADPSDAEIYINGNRAGTGTASQSVKRNRDVQVMVKKAGYSTVNQSIGTHMSGTAVADIIGGVFFLVPLIGLATPGARDLNNSNISITLPAMSTAQPDATTAQVKIY